MDSVNWYEQLKASVQHWRKFGFRHDFWSRSESAEIWHAYSSYVKKCFFFIFEQWEKSRQTCMKIYLPLSSNNVGFGTVNSFTVPNIGGRGGGGGLLCMCIKTFLPACGKKEYKKKLLKEKNCQSFADALHYTHHHTVTKQCGTNESCILWSKFLTDNIER